MRNPTLLLCLVALVGAIASGVMFFVIGNSKQELHARWQNAESKVIATEVRLSAAQQENSELENRVRSLDTDLATTKRELTELQLTAEQSAQALQLAEEARNEAIAARDSALADLTTAHTDLASMRRELAQSLSADEAVRYRRTIVDLESRVGELERELVRKNADPSLISGRANHAQVMRVGPRNAFVVINFGSDHGAQPNQQLHIKRGVNLLAIAEISTVKEHYSIAQVLPETLSGSLRKGDAASLTL